MNDFVIALASDHAGFEKKQLIINYFMKKGIKYSDLGCYSADPCDYPDYAHKISQEISKGTYPMGITFCGTGQGMCITENKYPQIRAALCWNPEIASLARQHNNANICSIPGRFVSDQEAIQIVDAFLNSAFEGGRHQRRIDKIPISPSCD